jgi:rhodanese-related sulfurtransferase
VLGTAVAMLGSLQAHLALHLLLGLEPSVLGRVVTVDAQRLTFGGFGFDGSPEPEEAVPFIAPTEVTTDDLVVDLRGVDEAPQPFAGGRRLSVDQVAGLAAQPRPAGRIVLCCRSGQRALLAADRLRERGLANLALVALG